MGSRAEDTCESGGVASAGRNAPLLLHRFLDAPLARHPDAVAIDSPASGGRPRRTLTYRQLATRSDALAARIAERTGPERIVAILLPREAPELHVAQLAVLKSGAAFACIEPSLPDDYARDLQEDAQADLLLVDAGGAARAAAIGVPPERVVLVNDADPAEPVAPPAERAAPGNLAYLIYTSGTTGRPKGVMIEHRSIANLVASDLDEFGLGLGDRVAQGSSPAYDSSIEETWLALAAGGTVVALDDRVVRSGPDLLSWLRAERISVFCPPPTLLRAMGCKDPRAALPELKLLYVGGEALPEDVAATWGAGRRLENGYGPTECAVTATRCTIEPGRPVTIGKPVRGNTAHVLDDELRDAPPGEVGELCLGGTGVARGYRGDPERTAAKFVDHPAHGRLYRTGDLVRLDERGDLVYLGRGDSQVKVRGHRIELEQIETRLAQLPGVREAACAVQGEGGRKQIVAHIVPLEPAAPPDLEYLRRLLEGLLPGPMVPARIGALAALPKSVGGKLDRKRLPKLELAAARDEGAALEGLAAELAARFAKVLALPGGVGLDSDFFLDLGGDSLAAAELVSLLREDPRTERITVRDLYAGRTVRALLAACEERGQPDLAAAPAEAESPRAALSIPRGHPGWFTCAQAAWILFELAIICALAGWLVVEFLPWLVERAGLAGTLVAVPLVAFGAAVVWTPLALLSTVILKRVLVGRYASGRHPAFGGWHLRHWIVTRAARRIPWRVLAGTELTSIAMRALGAKVGRGVHFHRGVDLVDGGWDLIELGDHATLAQDATLHAIELDAGTLVAGRVRMGVHSSIGIRSGLASGAELADGCVLSDLSWLAADARTAPGEAWDGVPARRVGRAPEPPSLDGTPAGIAEGVASLCLRALARLAVEAPLVGAALLVAAWFGLDQAALLGWLEAPRLELELVLLVGAVLVLRVPATLLVEGLLVRWLAPTLPTVCRRGSLAWDRLWIASELSDSASSWLSGSLMWPMWLRAAGMKIGRNSEVSTLIDLVPGMVEIGDECFLADGIYLAGPRLRSGVASIERTRIGHRTFVGNHATIPSGERLPDDITIGVSTVATARSITGPGIWFGHPPFHMARKADPGHDRALTHEPGLARRVSRWSWELLRFALPLPIAALALGWAALAEAPAWRALGGHGALLGVMAATIAAGAAAVLFLVASKWLLIGRVRPGTHPLWSCWCSRWDFLFVAWSMIGRGFLAELEGTLMLNAVLRWFGVRIGKRVLLGAGFSQVVDPDMLSFEDDSTVVGNFQAHTFEDRVLKIDHVRIRAGATVGHHAVLFYGSDIGACARVAPHGVVLKGERLAGDADWSGVPVQRVARR
jgi:non-ribosomal peptide synthetase-like protein